MQNIVVASLLLCGCAAGLPPVEPSDPPGGDAGEPIPPGADAGEWDAGLDADIVVGFDAGPIAPEEDGGTSVDAQVDAGPADFDGGPAAARSPYLGSESAIEPGTNPQIAVGTDGRVHAVFEGAGIRYVAFPFPDPVPPSRQLATSGWDPDVAVDGLGRAHVVWIERRSGTLGGDVRYLRVDPGAAPGSSRLLASGEHRKPRVVATPDGHAFVGYEDTTATQRVRVVPLDAGGTAGASIIAGRDNLGGMTLDGRGTLHLVWRDNRVYHTSVDGRTVSPATQITDPASDFSAIALDPVDGSLAVAAVGAAATSILLTGTSGGAWIPAFSTASSLLAGTIDPDHVNPEIAVDAARNRYVTFAAGGALRGWLLVIGGDGRLHPAIDLRPGSTDLGRKFDSPSLVTNTVAEAALVAYRADGVVYLRPVFWR